jgi:hypothetical protein
MGVSALFLSTAFLAFLIAGYRGALYARGRRKPTEIPLMVTTIALGMAGVFLAPATQTLESAFVPSLGRLLSNVCMLVAAFGWLHLMLYISHPAEQVPARMRTRLITLLIAIAVMAVMFFASSRPTGTGILPGSTAVNRRWPSTPWSTRATLGPPWSISRYSPCAPYAGRARGYD